MPDSVDIPHMPEEKYNQKLQGFFGEFGGGGNAQCLFVQTGIRPQDLTKIALVSEIEGSERWPVRDLFQREVDVQRVSDQILPYFRDIQKVKFFNPLTLTLLPLDPNDPRKILTVLPHLEQGSMKEGGRDWTSFEYPGFFQLRYVKDAPQYGIVEWNDSKVRVVAIDGQHRLSALRRCGKDPEAPGDFFDWIVPAVVFGLTRIEGEKSAGTVLDFVRNVFVYINSTARQPNLARTILLTDEDINMVCVQELLQYSHDNDIADISQRDPSITPLLFFDWRGVEEAGRRQSMPGTMYKVEDLYDWMENYLLNENFTPKQESALQVQPTNHILKAAFSEKRLTIKACGELRTHFRKNVLPGITHFFQTFKPFKVYIEELREIEEKYCVKKDSDLARHAFHHLRFGCSHAGENEKDGVLDITKRIVGDIIVLKNKLLLDPLRQDIGIRGVMCAFGNLRTEYFSLENANASWLEYSEWFTRNMNRLYNDGWLDDTNKKKVHRLHLTYDHNDTVANYRLEHADRALGPYLEILVIYYALAKKDLVDDREQAVSIWDRHSDTLLDTMARGYRKHWRPILKEQEGFTIGPELNKEVKKRSEESAEKQLDKFDRAVNNIVEET